MTYVRLKSSPLVTEGDTDLNRNTPVSYKEGRRVENIYTPLYHKITQLRTKIDKPQLLEVSAN